MDGSFSLPENGTIIEPTETGLIYMPNKDFCGYDSFDYQLTADNTTASATVTIHIACGTEAVVDCPIEAADDEAIVRPDSFIIISPLDNDACGGHENDLTVSFTTDEMRGVAEVSLDGKKIRYTPNANVCHDSTDGITDVVLYTAINQAGSSHLARIFVDICCWCIAASENATIQVVEASAVNDEVTVHANSGTVVFNVLDNDVASSGGGGLSVRSIMYGGSHGECLVVDGAAVSYKPNEGYHGQDNCVYLACDESENCDSAVLTVTVRPPYEERFSVTTNMNAAVQLETRSSYLALSGDGDHGRCSITTNDPAITFTPNAGFAGYDEVSSSGVDYLDQRQSVTNLAHPHVCLACFFSEVCLRHLRPRKCMRRILDVDYCSSGCSCYRGDD